MEELLGVNARRSTSHVDFGVDTSRHDVNEADALEEAEGGDWARQKYRRMFWESISEGEQVSYTVFVATTPNIFSF